MSTAPTPDVTVQGHRGDFQSPTPIATSSGRGQPVATPSEPAVGTTESTSPGVPVARPSSRRTPSGHRFANPPDALDRVAQFAANLLADPALARGEDTPVIPVAATRGALNDDSDSDSDCDTQPYTVPKTPGRLAAKRARTVEPTPTKYAFIWRTNAKARRHHPTPTMVLDADASTPMQHKYPCEDTDNCGADGEVCEACRFAINIIEDVTANGTTYGCNCSVCATWRMFEDKPYAMSFIFAEGLLHYFSQHN